MPKAKQKSGAEKEMKPVPLGVINPHETEKHRQNLEDVVRELQRCVNEEEVWEIVKMFIENVKKTCTEIYALTSDSNIRNVLHSIKDPYVLALWPVTEETEAWLEAIMPYEEIPEGEDVAQRVECMALITPEIKEMIISLMDHTAEARYQVGLASEQLLVLAIVCTLAQLAIIIHCAARPNIQVLVAQGPLESTSGARKKKELPDVCTEWVNFTLLPDPDALSLWYKDKSSPTWLLAGIVYYIIQKNFRGGCTQTHIVSSFGLQPKTMVLCVMGKSTLAGQIRRQQWEREKPKRWPPVRLVAFHWESREKGMKWMMILVTMTRTSLWQDHTATKGDGGGNSKDSLMIPPPYLISSPWEMASNFIPSSFSTSYLNKSSFYKFTVHVQCYKFYEFNTSFLYRWQQSGIQ